MKITSRGGALFITLLLAASATFEVSCSRAGSQSGVSPVATSGRTFYVAPDGRDSWSGRLAAPNARKSDGPFASIGRARDAVRAVVQAGLNAPVTVSIRDGEYQLSEPLNFGASDSGTARFPIIYAAFKGEHPVLSGGAARQYQLSVAVPGQAAKRWSLPVKTGFSQLDTVIFYGQGTQAATYFLDDVSLRAN